MAARRFTPTHDSMEQARSKGPKEGGTQGALLPLPLPLPLLLLLLGGSTEGGVGFFLPTTKDPSGRWHFVTL